MSLIGRVLRCFRSDNSLYKVWEDSSTNEYWEVQSRLHELAMGGPHDDLDLESYGTIAEAIFRAKYGRLN